MDAQEAGRKRWEGKSLEEKAAHARMMNRVRWERARLASKRLAELEALVKEGANDSGTIRG